MNWMGGARQRLNEPRRGEKKRIRDYFERQRQQQIQQTNPACRDDEQGPRKHCFSQDVVALQRAAASSRPPKISNKKVGLPATTEKRQKGTRHDLQKNLGLGRAVWSSSRGPEDSISLPKGCLTLFGEMVPKCSKKLPSTPVSSSAPTRNSELKRQITKQVSAVTLFNQKTTNSAQHQPTQHIEDEETLVAEDNLPKETENCVGEKNVSKKGKSTAHVTPDLSHGTHKETAVQRGSEERSFPEEVAILDMTETVLAPHDKRDVFQRGGYNSRLFSNEEGLESGWSRTTSTPRETGTLDQQAIFSSPDPRNIIQRRGFEPIMLSNKESLESREINTAFAHFKDSGIGQHANTIGPRATMPDTAANGSSPLLHERKLPLDGCFFVNED